MLITIVQLLLILAIVTLYLVSSIRNAKREQDMIDTLNWYADDPTERGFRARQTLRRLKLYVSPWQQTKERR